MKTLIFFLLSILVAPAVGQAVHRCDLPDGKVVYQPTPCVEGTGKVVTTSKPTPPPWTPPAFDSDAFIKDYREQQELLKSAQENIGMTKAQFLKNRREPDKINTTATTNGIREQWIYLQGSKRAGQGTEYYYFENGKLVAVQASK